jgi:hypothetical protein
VIGDIVAIGDEVIDELILKVQASVIATDMNAHTQLNHGRWMGRGKPAKRWGYLAGFIPNGGTK